jgi:hypothetical protein
MCRASGVRVRAIKLKESRSYREIVFDWRLSAPLNMALTVYERPVDESLRDQFRGARAQGNLERFFAPLVSDSVLA